MRLNEAVNRGRNLLAISLIALPGLAFFLEFFMESEWPNKLDEVALFFLGIAAVFWYLKGDNRFKRSLVPTIMVAAGMVIKIAAVAIEFADKDDLGDDFGGLILLICAFLLVWWQYQKAPESD
jgi:hypothetical protein